MTKTLKEIEEWYEDNLGDFDVEQGNMIEYLIDVARKVTKKIPVHQFVTQKRKWDYAQLIEDVGLRPAPKVNDRNDTYGSYPKLTQAGPRWYRITKTATNSDGEWIHIIGNGNTGWVLNRFCKIKLAELVGDKL